MNSQERRALLHKMVDRLMDIQDKNEKTVFFSFNGHSNNVSYHLALKSDYRAWVKEEMSWVQFDEWTGKSNEETLDEFLKEVFSLDQVDNESVPVSISLKMTKAEAREKGLIA